MASTLSIINNFELTSNGTKKAGKQGLAADTSSTPLELSLAAKPFAASPAIVGTNHYSDGQIATATVNTIWDDDNDFPIDWDFLYFWADQDVYLQIVGAATNVTFKINAGIPFTLSYDQILAAENTTIITGGTEPTMEDIDSVVLGNYSGNTANYLFCVVN